MLALQGGKVKAECAVDAGLRVVMLGSGLQTALLFVKSLQHYVHVMYHYTIRPAGAGTRM